MSASPNIIIDAVTAQQARAARALLGWSQDYLAEVSGIPKRTIARLELGGMPQRRTTAAIRTALESAGVEFIPNGVRVLETEPARLNAA